MPALPRQLSDLARMLAYILGHRPDEFGLVLADDGFVPIKRLLQALAAEPGWGWVRLRHLEELAVLAQPPVVEIRGEAIRGLIPGPAKLREPGAEPPPLLYLAIPPKAHDRVWEEGLKPAAGQELLLAADPGLALKLGKRRTPEPVLVTVRAQAAAKSGLSFTGYGQDLYLAPALPRDFLQIPPLPKEPEKARPKPTKPEVPLPPPGALPGDLAQAALKAQKAGQRKGEPAWKTASRKERRKRRS